MWQRFTEQARRVVIASQVEARDDGSQEVQTYHLLLGITRECDCRATEILEKFGLSPRRVRDEVGKLIPPPAPQSGETSQSSQCQDKQFSDAAKKVLQLAYNEARQLSHPYVGTEHLLLGLLSDSADVSTNMLRGLDVQPDEVRRRVVEMFAADEAPEDAPEPPPRAVRPDAPAKLPPLSAKILSWQQLWNRESDALADVLERLRTELDDLRWRVEVLENKPQED